MAKHRIGRTQKAAVAFVKRNPGLAKLQASKACFPQSTKYGYAAVDRAILSGYIEARYGKGKYELYVTAKGEEALEQ